MIVVKVELWSAVTGQKMELARMEIANDGEASAHNPHRGSYEVRTLRGRSAPALDKRITNRSGKVVNHARLALHVWHLVAKALAAMNYGEGADG